MMPIPQALMIEEDTPFPQFVLKFSIEMNQSTR
jgi:hypothetical protein